MPAKRGVTGRRRSLLGDFAAQLGFDFGDSPKPLLGPPGHAAEPLEQVIGLPSWQHPQATHQIKLSTAYIGYHLKRSKRRTIGMSVGMDGVVVQAPRWVGLAEIEAVLAEKGTWLLAKLGEMQTRQKDRLNQRIQWCDGATFPVLDRKVKVVLNPTHATAQAGGQLQTIDGTPVGWVAAAEWSDPPMDPAQPLTLHLALPRAASEVQIRDAVQAWLMRFAHQVFTARLDRYAPELGVTYTVLRLSSANTRWGSADVKGQIRLNWRLIHGPLSALDYVVVHELSHLREMNHSPKFWGTVASVLPDYAGERRRLNALQLPVW
jgi:predicted metal-dependent hydrolase